ncbi:MAG: lactate racemase domain-containing protein [Bryobacteraceae bacterium]
MELPGFLQVEQRFPDRSIPDIPAHIRRELSQADFLSGLRPGSRLAIGVGSRGISNLTVIVKAVVDFWKERGVQPFLFPAMGSHGAATAEGQADVLAHYGIHEATMGVPVLSSLDVVPLGETPEGIPTFMDKHAFESDAVFLVGRVKWHTDFAGGIESGLFKMMAIGLGKFAGAQRYHTFGYKLGLERVVRSVGTQVLKSGKVIGGLAIQEGAHHETAGLHVVSALRGAEAMMKREEEILREVKTWMAKLPAPEIDILIVDEIGKNISGAGMDTKVVNRSVNGEYNPWPDTPRVHRIYLRGLSSNTYHNGVGLGMADVVHNRLVEDIDWNPTQINSLTASTPAAIRTPIHFATDRECLSKISPTVGKHDLNEVTYCRITNTLELVHLFVSENLAPSLYREAHAVSKPFRVPFDSRGNFADWNEAALEAGGKAVEVSSHG